MDPEHVTYAYFLLTFGFCIPSAVVILSSFMVLIKLKQVRARTGHDNKPMRSRKMANLLHEFTILQHSQTQMSLNKNKSQIVNRERKVTFMVMLMVMAFLVAWSPYAILCFLRLLGFMPGPTLVGSAMLFAKSSGSTNPIIFIFLNTQVIIFTTMFLLKL